MIDKELTVEQLLNTISTKANDSTANQYKYSLEEATGDVDYILSDKNNLRLETREVEYESIFKNTNVGIVYTDAQGYITLANAAFQELSQYSLKELSEFNFISLIYPEDLQKELVLRKNAREGQRKAYSREQRLLCKDGKVVWTNTFTTFFRENVASPLHSVTVVYDINDKKIYEQQLLESNAIKDKFFSIISHDLRNPIASIKVLSTFIKDELQQKNLSGIAELSDLLSNQVNHVQKLLDNLLEWSQAQTKQTSFKPKRLNIVEILGEQTQEHKFLADNKHIVLDYTNVDQIFVIADAEMLKTVLRNLITNAIKFSYKNSIITIKAKKRPDDVLITVEDQGKGIDPSIFDHLFSPNFKTTTPGTHNENGAGIGLLLCREFVELHGGKIWAQSGLEKGSKFLFTLPNPLK